MTNAEPNSSSALPAEDPRAVFARAVVTARASVDGVRADQFELATPCSDYAVAELLGHMLGVFGRVAAAGNGDDVMAVNTEPPFAPVADWSAAFAEAAHAVRAAWTDDSKLQRMIVLPWAQLPGAAMLAMYTNELTVHTWDLARATSQTPDWDAAVLDVAMGAIQLGLPADGRIAGIVPFAEVVSVPDEAPMIDRLVAWNGRRP